MFRDLVVLFQALYVLAYTCVLLVSQLHCLLNEILLFPVDLALRISNLFKKKKKKNELVNL